VLVPPAVALATAFVAPGLLEPALLVGAGFGLHALVAKRYVDRAREDARLADEAARVAALEELNRLKSEFISIASHELRTPMTTIMGFSELLLEHDTPPETRQRWIAFINKESCQLSALIDDMLDVSRIETGRVVLRPRPVDLPAAVDEVLAQLAASAPSHTLSTDLAPAAGNLIADPEKLRQILTNLVSNAIKYSPNGGRVGVTARLDGDRVNLAVSDEGVGIPPGYRERIFDRFQRVESAETRGIRGTGLGLYIVRHLVELHGGTIEVESEPGQGSTFRVSLPRVSLPAAR
jgi:signal transduction histidine kinase